MRVDTTDHVAGCYRTLVVLTDDGTEVARFPLANHKDGEAMRLTLEKLLEETIEEARIRGAFDGCPRCHCPSCIGAL